MKKTIFTGLIFFAALTLLSAQETSIDEVSDSSSINIDEIAEELVSEDAADTSELSDVIEEEVVFDEENSEGFLPENTAPAIPDNYWRGKVAVAASNEYPKGLFAMAKGYFPGDTLTVINGKTQASVNVLIIGSIEQTEDIGIKFSQEAASALKISEQTDASVILDERINPPEIRETATAKLTVFGLDENDFSGLEQPLSINDDQIILSKPVVVEEAAEVSEEESETKNAASELPDYIALPLDEIVSENPVNIEANTANTSDQAYAPIILDLPASVEETAKVEEEIIEEEKSQAAEENINLLVKEEVLQEKPIVRSEPEKVETKVSKAPVPFKKLIANEKMIRSGYYIQLSFLTNEENLEKFAKKYSSELKLFFIPHKNGYKIFSGVFGQDDCEAALKYVQNLGFKDAFVRKMGK